MGEDILSDNDVVGSCLSEGGTVEGGNGEGTMHEMPNDHEEICYVRRGDDGSTGDSLGKKNGASNKKSSKNQKKGNNTARHISAGIYNTISSSILQAYYTCKCRQRKLLPISSKHEHMAVVVTESWFRSCASFSAFVWIAIMSISGFLTPAVTDSSGKWFEDGKEAGFKFDPTDQQLVSYHLRRKVLHPENYQWDDFILSAGLYSKEPDQLKCKPEIAITTNLLSFSFP
ncbi:hypothetical protein EJ110_NYTH57366 [Nymphaea thermarum]|nr:hypothetical protein EJ110_NYTH57366 [Nymphaea thermarum]